MQINMIYAIKEAQDLSYYGMGSQRYLSDDNCYADSVGVLTRGTAKTQIKRDGTSYCGYHYSS